MDVPRALVRLSPQDLVDGAAAGAGKSAGRSLCSASSPFLRSSFLSLFSPPLSGQVGRVPGSEDQRFVQVRMQRRKSWDRPALRGPAPPTPPLPQFPCVGCSTCLFFGILCLNNPFCLLHFKFSPLTERLAAEDWRAAHGRAFSLAV